MPEPLKRTLIAETLDRVGETVKISGWVRVRRDHGKLIFFDLIDASGEIQMVMLPQKEAHAEAGKIRTEWVIEVTGKINQRPERLINKEQMTGAIEMEIETIMVLNEAQTTPFDVRGDGMEIGEEHRLTYRYLDIRRERLQKNLKARHEINQFIRNFLGKENFLEIETPLLTKSTPEGARDFLVPSRIEQGKFYALPQSPQQYKQLLMVGGIEKYFQIARCFRDEDTRGDRQPEFTQLDMEMSFVDEEDIISINERLIIEMVTKIFPEKKIQAVPFPRMTYRDAMENYQSDRPDIREDKNDPNLLAFCWVTDFPQFEKTSEGKWTFTHNPFSMPKREHLPQLMNEENIENVLASQYDIVLNGLEIGGGSIRAHKKEVLEKIFKVMGYEPPAIKENFGHMLEAFSYGTPPHGGIAWGLDRLLSILLNEPNIREVIAFAKTGEGKDLMMAAPSLVAKDQLDELGLKVAEKTRK